MDYCSWLHKMQDEIDERMALAEKMPGHPAPTCRPTEVKLEGESIRVVDSEDECGAPPAWELHYLDGSVRLVCERHTGPASVLSLMEAAFRLPDGEER